MISGYPYIEKSRLGNGEKMKTIETIESFSEEETFQLGKRIGEGAREKDVFALLGDLGVGKGAVYLCA